MKTTLLGQAVAGVLAAAMGSAAKAPSPGIPHERQHGDLPD